MAVSKPDEQQTRTFGIFKKTILKIVLSDKSSPVYLIRWSLFSCPWFSIKLHNIQLSDDDCMHDHPWSFLSLILNGGYYEHTPAHWLSDGPVKKWYGPGRLLWRPSPWVHKLEIPEGKQAWTLVVTFKRKRDWGFITPSGWVQWSKYIRSGRKCE
jgi:hypothetical protein